ncbi:MAG: hypothetical protein KKH41_02485 [Candidatus Thermoplasmatota archaeon]|nr:hypothetical protein [Euryarchaeota archaeon]MBU4032070.1 hypothetical protein [Candidatus Thermoplasmatota archaeon]MBU4072146.1 hypothetical protein [Candidatus Thermoplasmatota archaeon]MBU4145047.1 hypothetical protein [Candidatus Thermoplasmatota archaeon]MBU4591430.1 hypothetical protein [Candidatus Thermoplasmatota archaeon]
MTDGIGKALASAIKEPAAAGPDRRGRHIFQNHHRRCIFSVLTMMPCVGTGRLASECGISQSTAEWHIEALMKSGYVVKYNSGRQRLFYPNGLITGEHSNFFETLNRKGRGDVFKAILANPGNTRTDIASATGQGRRAVTAALANLEDRGLINRVTDGALARYYPTGLLPERAEEYYTNSKKFSDFIIRKLENEGGKPPTVIKKSLERVLVEMGYASDRFTMEVGINPYLTCTVC